MCIVLTIVTVECDVGGKGVGGVNVRGTRVRVLFYVIFDLAQYELTRLVSM